MTAAVTEPHTTPSDSRRRRPDAATTVVLVAAGLVAAAHVVVGARLTTIVGFLGAGDARRPLLGYAVLVALLGAAALSGSVRARQGALVCAAVLPVLVAVLTGVAGQAWSLLATVLLALALWRIGRAVLDLLRVPLPPLCAAVIGVGIVATAVQVLGRTGLLRWWTVGVPVLLFGVLALVELGRAVVGRLRAGARPALTPPSLLPAFVFALLLVQLAWSLIYAAAPDAQYDAIYAKEWLPEQWALTGRIETPVDHPLLANTGTAQLVAALGWLVGAEGVGRYLQVAALVGIVGTLLTWRGLRPGLPALLAALGIGLMPHVLWQTGTAYDDLVLGAVCLGAAIGVWTLLEQGRVGWRAAVAVGLLSGTVLATKLHMIVFAALLGLLWALLAAGPARQRLLHVVTTAVAALAAAGAGPLVRFLDTGNPVFPQLNSVFRSEFYPPVSTTLNFPYAPGGVRELLRLPMDAVIEPAIYTEAVPPGAFGFSLVLLLAGLVASWRGGRSGRIVGAVLIVTLVAWWLQFRYLRYLLPYVVVAAGAVAAGWSATRSERVLSRGGQRLVGAGVAGVAVALFASSLGSFWNIPGRVPADVAFGQISRADYQRQVVPGWTVLQDLNRLAEPGAVVTGDAYARTALRDDLDYSPLWEVLQRAEVQRLPAESSEDLLRVLDHLDIRWVALRTESRIAAEAVEPPGALVRALRLSGKPVSTGGGFELYRLGAPAKPEPVPLCDPAFRGQSLGPGTGSCWDSQLDQAAGLEPAEAPAGTTQVVPICPRGVYELTAVGADVGTAAFLTFDSDPALERYSTAAAVAPGELRVLGTAPEGASMMSILVVPRGDGLRSVRLSRVSGHDGC